MKRYLTISAWLVICVVAFGCRQKPSAENERERPEQKQVTKVAADGVAVTVNGIDITEKEVEAEVKKMAMRRSPAYLEKNKEQIRRQVLDRMITMSLIDEKIKAANIVVTEENVLARIKEIAAQQRMSVEEFKKMLQSRGMDYDEWEQQMQFERRIGFEKFAEVEFADQLTITENDANDFYTANIKRFGAPEQVKASHILIKPDTTDPAVDPDEAEVKALAKAQDLLKQVKEGADFAELAKANSDCLSKAKGGDLGYFGKGHMEAPFEKVAFELKVNEVGDIVRTKLGYHIIKVTDRKEASLKTFEQSRGDIIEMLKQQKLSGIYAKYLTQLRAEAKIVYPPGKEPPPVTPRP